MLLQLQLAAFRRLTFTREYLVERGNATPQPTWQKALENGDAEGGRRKDPKYATHGLHPYKGKFYPQLAKALMNVAGISSGTRILDPFCGSGTTLRVAKDLGRRAIGVDISRRYCAMSANRCRQQLLFLGEGHPSGSDA